MYISKVCFCPNYHYMTQKVECLEMENWQRVIREKSVTFRGL